MFGFSSLGVYGFGEFPPFRAGFALVAQLSVVPAIAGRLDIRAAHLGSSVIRPR